jgi:hypothetical protein
MLYIRFNYQQESEPMVPSAIELDVLQKLVKFPYFIFVLSILLFSDTFLIAFANTSFSSLPNEWFKTM